MIPHKNSRQKLHMTIYPKRLSFKHKSWKKVEKKINSNS